MCIKRMHLPPILAWVQVNMYLPQRVDGLQLEKAAQFKNSSLVQFQRSHFTNYLPQIILSRNLGHTTIETINTFFS